MTLKYFKYLLIFATIFLSCKRRLFDHRNKYIGTWEFSYVIHECSNGSNPPCTDQTGTYTGKIYYDKRIEPKNVITIEFSQTRRVSYEIDKKGNFTGCGLTGKIENEKTLAFIKIGSSVCTLALGSSYSYTVTGTKK